MASSIPLVDDDPQSDEQLLITDIALSLLGNEFYNVHGERENNLSELIKNNPRKRKNKTNRRNDIDVLAWLDSIPIQTDVPGASTTSKDSTSTSNSNDNNDNQLPSCKISKNNPVLSNSVHENFDENKFNSLTIDENNSKLLNNNELIDLTDDTKNEMPKEKRDRLNEIQNSLPILKQQANKNVLDLIEGTEKQYEKMKNNSKKLENKFLKENANLINLKSIKLDDAMEKFYTQQRSRLKEENKALIEFMEILKHQDDDAQLEKVEEFSKDILEVENYILMDI